MIDAPALNALLNFASLICLITGRIAITSKNVARHKTWMLLACFFSVLFFCSYLHYHYNAQMTTFPLAGWVRYLYYTILLTHIPLAILVVPAACCAVYFGLTHKITAHIRLVRWLFPIWVYVSTTGMLIYLMLYQLPKLFL
ncbi:MAG: DUF420 domain-containing protein [Pseudomonadota bacterium]|nr:DUF420 domain-containing protein [Pseudomonadota bacterium]